MSGPFVVPKSIETYFDGPVLTVPANDVPEEGDLVVLFDPDYEFCQFRAEMVSGNVVKFSPPVPWPGR